MLLIPAIDLKDGLCVRLLRGRFEESTIYGRDPAAMARRWDEAGAEWIHLVDLDASLGDDRPNLKAVEAVRAATSRRLQLGGGLKSMKAMERLFDLGVDRLIMGTAVCENPALVEAAAARWPGRVAAALDASGRALKTWGWREDGGVDLLETAARLKSMGVSLVVHTDVDRDGAQVGPNLDLSVQVSEISGLPTLISGGVAGLDDLKALKDRRRSAPGLIGAISGRALYEGTLDYRSGASMLAEGDHPDSERP
jgi:phosphoribosylformimino-5-aminoimidazole carboxamide ribotide isomerase